MLFDELRNPTDIARCCSQECLLRISRTEKKFFIEKREEQNLGLLESLNFHVRNESPFDERDIQIYCLVHQSGRVEMVFEFDDARSQLILKISLPANSRRSFSDLKQRKFKKKKKKNDEYSFQIEKFLKRTMNIEILVKRKVCTSEG